MHTAKYIGLRFDTLISSIDSNLFAATYSEINAFVAEKKIPIIGSPVCITYLWDQPSNKCELFIGMPVSLSTSINHKRIELVDFLRSEALLINYYGQYENIWMAHMAMDKFMFEKGKKATISIEEYVTDPLSVSTYDSVLTRLDYITE